LPTGLSAARRTTGLRVSSPRRHPRGVVSRRLPRSGVGTPGYTPGMKTAVSIPDQVFREAEELVLREGGSRSGLYSRALAEYVARHAPDLVTEAMDSTLAEVDEQADAFVVAASRRVLERSDW